MEPKATTLAFGDRYDIVSVTITTLADLPPLGFFLNRKHSREFGGIMITVDPVDHSITFVGYDKIKISDEDGTSIMKVELTPRPKVSIAGKTAHIEDADATTSDQQLASAIIGEFRERAMHAATRRADLAGPGFSDATRLTQDEVRDQTQLNNKFTRVDYSNVSCGY